MIKILAVVLLAGYALVVAATGLRQWRQKLIPGGFAFGLLLGSAIILTSAYLLYINSTLTMGLVAAGLLVVHILAVFIARHLHGRINWPYQAGRAFILLFLFILVYFALN
ncbi:MAG TPA: hypothetical protein VI688_03860 [Anaerolineales bacterium]|nr:hypothetical protein [Anaerolineales bacterium]